jgi:hypothetical protein
MGGRRCCCGGNCYLLIDDFDDAESTTLSSDWSEVSGDWEYDGTGLLVENGTASSAVLTTKKSKTTEQFSQGIVPTGFSVGDKFRVIANALDDDNYLFAEVEVEADGYDIRLCSRIGGAESIISEDEFEDVLDDEQTLGIEICLSKNIFVCTVDNMGVTPALGMKVYHCDPPIIAGGKHAGLGNGAATDIYWDEFAFGDLVGDGTGGEVSGQCRQNQCCEMPCTCCENGKEVCIPRTLLLTFSGSGGCAVLDGVSVYLYYNPGSGDWRSDLHAAGCFTNMRWVFSCTENICTVGDEGTFNLSLREEGSENCAREPCAQVGDQGRWEDSYQCYPFEVTFPGQSYLAWELSEECTCCDELEDGAIGFIVTEAA